jgi:hypothetical protein
LSTKTWTPEVRGGKVVGAIEGPVKEADTETSTIRVASGLLGFSSLPLVVTPQTQIAVNGKLGGFADLDRGQLIRVTYEVLPDRFVASRVDVLDRWSQGSDAVVLPSERQGGTATTDTTSASQSASQPSVTPASQEPARAAAPGAIAPTASPAPEVSPWRAVPPVPSTAPAPSASAAPTRPTGGLVAPSAKRAGAPPTPPPRIGAETPRPAPAARAPVPKVSAPAPRVSASAPAATATAPAATVPPARSVVTPGASQQEDGTAVIDWLTKERSEPSPR